MSATYTCCSFVSLDSGCDSKVTTGNIVRLFVEDKVDAFIGPPCSSGLTAKITVTHTSTAWKLKSTRKVYYSSHITYFQMQVHEMYDCESKKRDTILLSIASTYIGRFSKFFHRKLSRKFAIKWSLNILPRLKYVATLLCERWMSKTRNNLN